MPGFFSKIKGALATTPATARAKSTNDLSYLSQIYVVKEKELPKLHLAAWKGDIDKTIQLCRPDKLNSLDKEGRTPIHLAVAGNHLNIVEHLLIEDAKLQILDKEGRSCFIIASIRGNPQIMDTLINFLDQKSLVNMPDKNGLNPLMYAIKNDNFQVLKVLLKEKNINLDHKDKDRNTALHYAVIRKKIEAIDLLIEHGGDIDAQNADGQTALMLAAKSGDEELMDVLLDYGADKLVKDKLGINAMKFAEMNGNPRCIELLKRDRPVKPNTSKLTRIKRSNSSDNNLSSSEHSKLTSAPTKKFENLFAGINNENNNHNRQQTTISNQDKYKTEDDANDDENSNTSKILTEEKSKQLTQNKRTDTWDDDEEDSEEEDDDSIENINKTNENLNANIKNKPKEDNDMGFLFQNLKPSNEDDKIDDFEIEINEDIFMNNNSNNNKSNLMNRSGSYHSEHGIYGLSTFLPKKNQSETNWKVYVHTSNIKGAGTDANVFIEIHGIKASSARLKLDNKNIKDQFESGKVDKFDVNLPDIGEPKRIKIGHDNKGSFAGWHLEKVVLENNLNGNKYLFNCNRWLAKDELDHKTEIDITVENYDKIVKSRDSLTSSWNSSEDEDSLSIGNKKKTLSPKNTKNLLNQIDEEKMNETLKSKNSITSQKKKESENKPPEISDFDESLSLSDHNQHGKEPAVGSLAYLIKNNKNTTSKNNLNLETTGSFSPTSTKNDTLNKLLNGNESNKTLKQSALSDLWKKDKNNKNQLSFEFSDEEEEQDKSHSITDLYDQFKNYSKPALEKPKEATINENESSVEFLIKNNLVPTDEKKNDTINNLVSLNKISTNKENNNKNAGAISSGLASLLNLNANESHIDKSDSLDDLEEMFNKAKESNANKSLTNNPPKIDDIDEIDENPLNFLIKKNTPQQYQTKNESDHSKNETLSSILNKENKPVKSNDNPTLSNLLKNNNNLKQNSFINEDNFVKSIKNSIENNDFDDSDENNDEIENLVRHSSSNKNNMGNGRISAAIGAVVSGNSTSSIRSMIQPQNSKEKQSFTSIIPELFDAEKTNLSSPRNNRPNLSILNESDSHLNELVDKLRQKNHELEKDKLELESKLRELDMEKKKFEKLFNHSDKELAEKERLIDKMNEEKLKSEYSIKTELNELKQLRKEINDLKEDKHALENKLSLYQANFISVSANQSMKSIDETHNSSIANINESLNIKIKALENQIEELNKDRKVLSACKEDLTIKLEETENDIVTRNEALKLATLKFDLEKKALNDENQKLKRDMNDLTDTKVKLQQEIDAIKLKLNEKYFDYEKLNLEKSNYEKQFDREKEDNEKSRRNYVSELSMIKDQQLKLTEKLGTAEAKLISTERDLTHTQSQIDEKEKQINSLRDELVKVKSDYTIQLNLLKIEKEEKESLIKKCESLEANLKRNNEDYTKTSRLKKASKLELNDNDIDDLENDKNLASIEKENSDLHKEVKNLLEKLRKTENEFEKYKTENELISLKKEMNNSGNVNNYQRTPPEIRKEINNENEKLKSEVQKLRDDFNQIINKYSNFDSNLNTTPLDLNGLSGFNTKSQVYDFEKKLRNDYSVRQNTVDVPALITDMPLKTIASLNNYLIKNIISQEEPSVNITPNIVLARGNSLYSIPIPSSSEHNHNYAFSSNNHQNLTSPKLNCKLCSAHSTNSSSAYYDLLKNEMSKKIEIEVAKGSPHVTTYSPRNLNRINLNNHQDRPTENFDSLYNTLSLNTKYSNLLNTTNNDLVHSLRTRFLI